MRPATIRESPVPVLIVLAVVFGFVEYLHWTVTTRETEVEVVQIPRVIANLDDADDDATDDGERVQDGAVVSPAWHGDPAGPLHAISRQLAGAGHAQEALARLDASLAAEGKEDASRLEERGVLMLRLSRNKEALANLTRAG